MQNKQRHGCLTAWLIYLIIAYSFSGIIYLFNSDRISNILPNNASDGLLFIYGSLAIFGVIFSIMLFKWVKLGFWGILIISAILFVVHLINDHGFFQPLIVLFFVIVLYSLLQLKKANISGWENLE